MKALKFLMIAVAVILVIGIGAIAYVVNSVVSGSQKDRLIAVASEKLGTKVTFDSYGLDFGSLLRLQPAVSVSGLKIANPPGFPERNMLEANEVALNLDLKSALSKKIEVRSLVVRQPRVLIEAPADGPTNLEALIDSLSKTDAAPAAATAQPDDGSDLTIGVGSVILENGVVALATPQDPQPRDTLKNVQLQLTGIRPGTPAAIDLSASFFESANSTFNVKGVVGPPGDKSLPLDGTISTKLALAEFPAEVMKRFLGELASSPGPDSRINLDLAMKGDLHQTLAGDGAVDFTKFMIGPEKANRLAVSGKAPLALRAVNALSGGELELKSDKASLKLGSGEWTGDLDVLKKQETLSGSVDGAIRSVDINQMLTSFAGSPDVLYGTATIPRFQVGFQGSNAASLQRSLNGNGSIVVSNGRFKGLSVLASIERALGGTPNSSGEFAKFATNFAIKNQAMTLSGIDVSGPGIEIAGQGTIGFNESLSFKLQSKLSGAAGELLKAKTGGFVSDVTIPVDIAGTVSSPQVRPNVSGLAKSAATSAIGNVLGGFLGGRKKK